MNGRNSSWWVWVFLGIVLLGFVSSTDGRFPVLPLVIGAIIVSKVLQRRSRVSRPQQRGQLGHGGAADHQHDPYPVGDGTTEGSQDSPMPTIDVPRYPGDGPLPGTPPPPTWGAPTPPPTYGTPAPPSGYGGPAPVPGYGTPSPSGPGTPSLPGVPSGAGPAPDGPAPHTSSDPVVSLGQLHLARCGRDLQAAAQHGSAPEVARVLDEVADLSRRMQDMLDAAAGTPGSGRREFQAGLRALDRLVQDARGEDPPGARVTRVTQVCLRMGHTGRHE